MGTKGFFPLFEKEWIKETYKKSIHLQDEERVIVEEFFQKTNQHKSLKRKKSILTHLSCGEREVFIRGLY